MSTLADQAIRTKVAIFVENILSLKSAVLANQANKDLEDLQKALVRNVSLYLSLLFDCFKKKYFTFVKRLKGGLGLENIETFVQFAEELESLSQPSKKALLIARRIRKETAELSENNPCPPSSNLPSTPLPTITIPPSKRKREDRSPSASSSHGLFEENSVLREELAATKDKLHLSKERFDNLRKILIQQIEGL